MRSASCALLLLAAAGCSRCGTRTAGAAEELLPAKPGAANFQFSERLISAYYKGFVSA